MRRLFLILIAASLAACGPAASGNGSPSGGSIHGTLTVFAAASLTDSFKALGADFEAAHPGVSVRFNFAGTPTLVTQIEQGAQPDVFASADMTNMDTLASNGSVTGTPHVFAHNKLEIVVAAGNPKQINGLAGLAKPGVIYISAAPTVPAGKYALQALAKAHVTVTPKSLETDVKSVVGKIELGEADAGIVYVTDVRAAGDKVQGVAIPDADNVIATYPIAEVKAAPNAEAAAAFIDFVRSARGQARLESFGFLGA